MMRATRGKYMYLEPPAPIIFPSANHCPRTFHPLGSRRTKDPCGIPGQRSRKDHPSEVPHSLRIPPGGKSADSGYQLV